MPDGTGVLLLDKAAGKSSFGAIAALRPVLGRKLGHAGTLDPFATGLLVVLAGRATRLATFLTGPRQALPRGGVRFGVTSTTDDPEGELARPPRPPTRTPCAARWTASAARSPRCRRQPAPCTSTASARTGGSGAGRTSRCPSVRSPSTPSSCCRSTPVPDRRARRALLDRHLHPRAGPRPRRRRRRRRLLQRAAPHRGGAVLDRRRRRCRRRHRRRAAPGRGRRAAPAAPSDHTRRGGTIAHGRRIDAHDEPAGPIVLLDGERLVAIGTRDGDQLRPGPVLG